jgi:hypothetical protein
MYAIVVGLTVALHLGLIAFVVFGGFVALRWRRTMWLHVPAGGSPSRQSKWTAR